MSPQTLTVLFADLADSTRLYQVHGDSGAHKAVSGSLQCMRAAIESNGGSLLRTVGDASLASFQSTDAAYLAAVQMQRDHQQLGLQMTVGFHYGEVIPDAGDVYGNAVNVAARVAAYAQVNEICTTEQALSRLSAQHRVNVHYLDNVEFKGIEHPMPVYRVHWQSDSALTAIVSAPLVSSKDSAHSALVLTLGAQRATVDTNNTKALLGRSADSNIVVDRDSVSRIHAAVELVRGRFMISDASTNGTYIVRHGAAMELLRRDSVALQRNGLIGLGSDPQSGSEPAIRYQIETDSS